MAEAHDRLKISAEDFAEVAQIFSDTLSKAGVEPADLQKVMADVATLESAVVARATD
jgi:truncated hemoglobin YjbI